jgi:hypothetical protein
MVNNQTLYTNEPDGTIQKWYLWGHVGSEFAVSTQRNGGFSDYKKYYKANNIGKTIFTSRKEAIAHKKTSEKE